MIDHGPDDRLSRLNGSAWPFVGRETERAALTEALATRRSVVVVGGAGSGKTRLVDQVLGERAEGLVSLRGTPTWAAIPYGAFVSLAGDDGAFPTPGAALARLRAALAASSDPGLLLVEDTQWLDYATAEVVATIVADEVQLVATRRASDDGPISRLCSTGAADRIEMAPLRDIDVAELIDHVVGREPSSDTLRRVVEWSDGNLWVLSALLSDAIRSDRAMVSGGLWHVDEPELGPLVAELMSSDLDQLADDEREALGLIALAEPIDLHVIVSAGWDTAAERLEASGLIVVERVGPLETVRVGRPLLAAHVRESMGGLRRRRLAGVLVAAVAESGARSDRTRVATAVLSLDLGVDLDTDELANAAATARLVFDCRTAERLAREAHERIDDVASLVALTDVLFERGKHTERESLLADWTASNGRDEATIAIRRAVGLFWGLGDLDGALAALDAASLECDVEDRTAIDSTAAALLSQSGLHLDALERLAQPDGDGAGRHGIETMKLWARLVSGAARGELTVDDVTAVIDPTTEESRRTAPAVYVGESIAAMKVVALASLGCVADARELGKAERLRALETGDVVASAFASLGLAWVELLAGALGIAQRHARDAAASFGRVNLPGQQRWAIGMLLLAAAQGRDREVVEEALLRLDEVTEHPARLFDATIERGRAAALVVDARRADAVATLEAAAVTCRRTGARIDELLCLHDMAVIDGIDSDQQVRMREVANSCTGDLAPLLVDHVVARAERDGSALDAVSGRFASIGALRYAAEAGMAAVDALAREGDQRSAQRMVTRAQALIDQPVDVLDGRVDIRLAVGRAARLTPREVEVGELAATGLTSRAIAERLYLSIRTVDNHLARVYAKLGASGRAELTEHFRRQGAA